MNLKPLIAALAAVAGCAYPHVYVPAQHATATLPESGSPAALYQIPTEAPRGEVTIGALGDRKVEISGVEHRQVAVRMIVKNNSDQPWRIDLSQQRLILPDGFDVQPTLAIGIDTRTPFIDVAPRGERRIDLVYDAGQKPPKTFQVRWAISTPTEYVTHRTDFRREELEAYAYGPPIYDGYFYTPYYYSYPLYPYYGFANNVAVPRRPAFPRVQGRRVYVVPSRPRITVSPPGRF